MKLWWFKFRLDRFHSGVKHVVAKSLGIDTRFSRGWLSRDEGLGEEGGGRGAAVGLLILKGVRRNLKGVCRLLGARGQNGVSIVTICYFISIRGPKVHVT